jgi:NitT/TauT family transport system substrate-binding protein
MRIVSRRFVMSGAVALAAPAVRAQALEQVTFGTNWLAQAEHGGFYQAVADGTYRRFGLDVTIVPGGPQVNNRARLVAGQLDFFMGGSLLQPFAAVAEGVPTVVVAAIFQKDPQALLSHPGQGIDRFEDLKSVPLLISRVGEASFYRWLIAEHGFRADQVRPYTFNPAPFCRDPRIGMQGFATSEPFAVRRACGVEPNVFLLADQGWDTYATLIETRRDTVAGAAERVQRFVDASIIGWMSYLHGDGAPADAAIKRANPDMGDDQIAFSKAQMIRFGLVDSGDAARLGVGAITEARLASFHARMARAGLASPTLDWRRAADLRFVNKRIGAELRR